MQVQLPPRRMVARPNWEDPLIYYYLPVTGYVYTKRLTNTAKLLGGGYTNLIDIGYGSGIFFLELSHRAKNLFGIDIHGALPDVKRKLEELGIRAELRDASLFQIPYPDNYFDAAVSVSLFEHIQPKDLPKAFDELNRILKRGGVAVVSFPARNFITDAFFSAIGFKPREIHPSGHWDIVEEARKHFDVEAPLFFPKFWPPDLSLYCSLRCVKR